MGKTSGLVSPPCCTASLPNSVKPDGESAVPQQALLKTLDLVGGKGGNRISIYIHGVALQLGTVLFTI